MAGPVGIYSMAFQFARLPFMLVTGPLQYVLYPHIAPLREDKKKLSALFLLFTRVLAMTVLPAVGLVAVASEPIFHVLLSKKWGQAAPIFVLIAPAAALQPVTAMVGTFLMALGRTDVQMRLAFQFAAVWLVGLWFRFGYGIEAVAGRIPSAPCCFRCGRCASACRSWLLPQGLRTRSSVACDPDASAILLYPDVRSSDNEVINICLAATLATVVIGISLIAQRRDLLAAFSLPFGRQMDLLPEPPVTD